MIQKSAFTLDPLGDQHFEGYASGRFWNGWACPLFTQAQAARLVAAWHEQGRPAGYDALTDTFWFSSLDPASTEAPEHFAGIAYEGETLYPIGAEAWIWDELTELEAQAA